MLKFYCLITGDEYNSIKDETPASKKKIRLYAVSIVIPVFIWAVSSFLLVSEVMKKDLMTALIAMVISVILIFMIEKSIIMSNGSVVIAAFRIGLGLILAVIGSLSLDEVIFKNDIDTQISENKEVYVNNALDNRKNELNKEITKKENELREKESLWLRANDEAIKESDGTGGSGIPNRGKITELKLRKADEMKAEYEKSKSELNIMKVNMDSALKVYEAKVSNGYNENSLLLRIQALFDLVKKDGWMKLTYIIFTLFIVFMESMVIVVKLFSKETNYERKTRLIEEVGKKRMIKIAENKLSVFDQRAFNGDLKESIELVRKPLEGMFS